MSQSPITSHHAASAPRKPARRLQAACAAILVAVLAGCAGAPQQREVTAMLHQNGRGTMSDASNVPASQPQSDSQACASTLTFVNDCGGFARYDGP